MNCFLGLDNGGSSTKAAIYDSFGRELAVASASTAMLTPKAGWTERDMEEMYEANCLVIREALGKSGVSAADIKGIAVCGHGKGLYLWGKDGKPARNGIISTDNRAWEYPVKWRNDGTEAKAFVRSLQHILPSQPVALLAWLQDNEPETLDKVQWIFECKDYVRFRLTGAALAERSDYSGAHLINLHTGEYDKELLELFGLGAYANKLPPLCDAASLCGQITQEAAQKTGLLPGTPVAGGAFDIDACAVAAGVLDDEHICMIAGTWSINEYVAPKPVTDGSVLMNSLFCQAGRYLIEESSPTSAGNSEWFVKTFLPELRQSGANVYETMNGWVASLTLDDDCPVFLPFVFGSNAHPNAKGSLVGLSAHHTRAHIARAIYEGVVFSHRYHFDRLTATRARPPRTIRLAGGAARSPIWAQMFANVMGYPVEVVAADETGALGCAMIAAAAAGEYANLEAAVASMCRLGARYEPDMDAHARYNSKYNLYTTLVRSLDGYWDAVLANGKE